MNIKNLGIIALSFSLFACGGPEKPVEPVNSSSDTMYQIDTESVSLNWTAYKTTDKVAVGGKFGKINVTAYDLAETPEGALDEVSFSVPISSLFTNNEDRDWKLKNLFFGIMNDPEFITGTFYGSTENTEEGVGTMELKMNGSTQKVSYDYKVENDSMFVSTTIDVLNWDAQEPMDSLNKACYDLHKGKDGVSKTWSEVAINASVALLKK